MSWQGQIIPVLRELINDTNEDLYSYSDERLEKALIGSAYLITRQVSFANTYVTNPELLTISPDPSTDYSFLSLVALRAAITVLSSEMKTQSLAAVRVVDGSSSIDMTTSLTGIKDLLKAAQAAFDQAKLAHQIGDGNYGKCIVGPASPLSDNAGGYYPSYGSHYRG